MVKGCIIYTTVELMPPRDTVTAEEKRRAVEWQIHLVYRSLQEGERGK